MRTAVVPVLLILLAPGLRSGEPVVVPVREYVSPDFQLTFRHPEDVLVVDRHNVRAVAASEGLSPDVQKDLKIYVSQPFQGIYVKDPVDPDGPKISITDLGPRLKNERIRSLARFLEVEERRLAEKKLAFFRIETSLGPDKIPAREYIRPSERKGDPRKIYNVFFEKNGRAYNISFLVNPKDSERLMNLYAGLKESLAFR